MSLAKPLAVRKKKPRGLRGNIHPVTFTRRRGNGRRSRDPVTKVPNFRSEFEREFWEENKAKIPLEYEPYHLKGTILTHVKYLPDFVSGPPTRPIIYETKGWFRAADRTKLKAIRESNPGIEIILVFQRDNYLTKARSMKYSQWCIKNSFSYCVGVDLSKIVRYEPKMVPVKKRGKKAD